MIVGVKAGIFKPPGLRLCEHPQRAADFDPCRSHLPDHFQDAIELRVVPHLAPGRAQTDATDSVFPGAPCDFQNRFLLHQRSRLDARVISRRLRTVRTVFRAGACLDGDQFADLHRGAVVIAAVDARSAECQVQQWQLVHGADFLRAPVIAYFITHNFFRTVNCLSRPRANRTTERS